MKRGFTLIELLIVMVIVGILVTIALPKYNASLERARAQEGIANLKAASDIMNAHYVMNGNQYKADGLATCNNSSSSGTFLTGDFTKSKYFTQPVVLASTALNNTCLLIPLIIVSRQEGDETLYSLGAYSLDGELKKITCANVATDANYCENIGAELKPDPDNNNQPAYFVYQN